MVINEYDVFKSGKGCLWLKTVKSYTLGGKFRDDMCVKHASDVAAIFDEVYDVASLPEEHIWALALDTKLHPIGIFEISHGTVDYSIFNVRDVFKRLLLTNATSFILVHNHPSGDAEISGDDAVTDERFKKAGDLIGIEYIDNIVVCGEKKYSSFRMKG